MSVESSIASGSAMGYFMPTGDKIIDATTNGYQWILQTDHVIDIAIANGFSGEYWNNAPAVAGYLKFATDLVSYYANIKFNYVGNYGNPSAAYNSGSNITLSLDGANHFFSSNNTWAIGFFPNSEYNNIYQGAPGDIYLNVNSHANYLPSFEPGSQGWFLLIHELGHALGLKHPHDDGGTGRPTYAGLGLGSFDIDWATIMSYNDDASWNEYQWDPATPMLFDVYALQYLYGKNVSTNAGDSVFKLAGDEYFKTIWDASGNDTLDASGNLSGWTIFLPQTSLSNLIDTKAGYALPTDDLKSASPKTLTWLAGDYENAIGTRYDDVISGNLFRNIIRAGGGNDFIDGGSGIDTAVYAGASGQYRIQMGSGMAADSVVGIEGLDTLINIERLKFSDINVALDLDGNAGAAYRLYKAAFDRVPDLGGLGFWISQLDKGGKLSDAAAYFAVSPEFQSLYGSQTTDSQFVNLLYQHVLHRAAEGEGYNFWVNALSPNGGWNRGGVLEFFSQSPENQGHTAELVANGIQYQEWVV